LNIGRGIAPGHKALWIDQALVLAQDPIAADQVGSRRVFRIACFLFFFMPTLLMGLIGSTTAARRSAG
jgi:hypothetical protein